MRRKRAQKFQKCKYEHHPGKLKHSAASTPGFASFETSGMVAGTPGEYRSGDVFPLLMD